MDSKKLVFWGVGNSCRQLLKYYNVQPDFFIDSNLDIAEFEGKKVFRPDEIELDECFIVVTVINHSDIDHYLKSHGLVEGKDYVYYTDYFGIQRQKNVRDNLKSVNNFIKQHPEYVGARIVWADIFDIRQHGKLEHFFEVHNKEYVDNGGYIILIANNLWMSDAKIKEQFNAQLLLLPKDLNEVDKNRNILKGTQDDMNFLKSVEQKYVSDEDKDTTLSRDQLLLYYFREIMKIIKPSSVITWYSKDSYNDILDEITDELSIPFKIMEFGIVPGTYQICSKGIDYRSDVYNDIELLSDVKISVEDNSKLSKVKQYILSNQTDTVSFSDEEDEINKIKGLDKSKKTVFFIGFDDVYTKHTYNFNNDLWKNNWGRCYNNYTDAAVDISNICKKRGWNFIYKPHPYPNDECGMDPDCLADGSVYIKHMLIDKLIDVSDVVVAVSSAACYKVLLNDKPLVTLGKSLIEKFGCTYAAENKYDIEEKVQTAIDNGLTESMKAKFDYMYIRFLKKYSWDNLDDRSLRYGRTDDIFQQ